MNEEYITISNHSFACSFIDSFIQPTDPPKKKKQYKTKNKIND